MTRAEPNVYSKRWFRFFHAGIDETRTTREVDFICVSAPLPRFHRVLDVCCGMGRHARALASRGYWVTGVDRDDVAIATARSLAGGPHYIQGDVRDYQPDAEAFDVVIVMSQSFGYFDATANRAFLQRLAVGLPEGGRVILDLWNPEFFASRQGERDLESPYGTVRESKWVENGRLFVKLDYPDGDGDAFEWQLFSPGQMVALADSAGLALNLSCTDFDVAAEPDSANPRIQFMLERPGNGNHSA